MNQNIHFKVAEVDVKVLKFIYKQFNNQEMFIIFWKYF